MPFPPPIDHRITLAQAAAMTKRYRDESPKGAIKGQTFPRDVLDALLKQPGVAGVRFYYGRETAGGSVELVAVAVDADGNDLEGGELYNRSYPCPPFCGETDSLNS
ncbi:MAG: hypothetical protein L0Z62_00340 [Gemmataceae bacterium]|nr:hypothetical protein [Gemmataceae bacterium]